MAYPTQNRVILDSSRFIHVSHNAGLMQIATSVSILTIVRNV